VGEALWAMACPCPAEERRAVYQGRSEPVPGRFVCALCGELTYHPQAHSTAAYIASASSIVASATPGSASTRRSQSGRALAATDTG
jgi:hypothetical protein